MRLLPVVAMLLGLAGCEAVHPAHGDGAASIPATSGGLSGAQEGSPGNATNVGSDNSTILNYH